VLLLDVADGGRGARDRRAGRSRTCRSPTRSTTPGWRSTRAPGSPSRPTTGSTSRCCSGVRTRPCTRRRRPRARRSCSPRSSNTGLPSRLSCSPTCGEVSAMVSSSCTTSRRSRSSTVHTERLEALVRWRHPEEGLLLPGRFLPLVERTAVMRVLTARSSRRRWRSCHGGAAGLRDRLAGGGQRVPLRPLRPRLRRAGGRRPAAPRVPTLAALARDHRGGPGRRPDPGAQATLIDLQAAGIELALDDFGTGHASLTRLKRVPVTEVKIDRAFVQGCESRSEQRAIVRAVVELGHGLGMRCVAEGVESAEILATLRELGCDVAQGFHIARPMPAEMVAPWLRAQRAGLGGCDRSMGGASLAGVGQQAHER
jgi:EAL domain-containing protein (putative c-di-GMP-specific phosphodiesterase class I)